MKNLKPLNWDDAACIGMDGINREVRAMDDVWIHGRARIYISYHVMRYDFNPQLMQDFPRPEYRTSIIIDDKTFCERCFDFDDGKRICESWRNKFWNDLIDEINSVIF